MLKALVVDDEPFIREGLKKLINWKELGFEVCGEAEDGKEALLLIHELKPNLVITDIRMIEMDGIELIKAVRSQEKLQEVRFIILSAYGEFEYAKQAMKYRVKDYVLKPIKYTELSKIIDDVRQDIFKEKESHIDNNKSIKMDLIDIIHGCFDNKSIKNIVNCLKIEEDSELRCGVIYGSKVNNVEFAEYLNRSNIFSSYENENSCIIVLTHINCRVHREENVEVFLNGILRDLKNILKEDVFILCGDTVKGFRNINASYNCAKELHKYKFYNSNKDLIIYDNNIKNLKFNKAKDNNKYLDNIDLNIVANNSIEIKKDIDKLFQYFRSELISPDYVKTSLLNFQLNSLNVLEKLNVSNIEINKENLNINLVDDVKWCDTLDSIRTKFTDFCIQASLINKEFSDNNSKDLMIRVKSYISANYRSKINIKDIAGLFYVNSVYLGQVYKKTYGMYINDFINHLRIEEAKKLLGTTSLKIYEIADKVGYSNDVYFINKFISTLGISPSDYRKQLSKEKE